MHRLICHAIKGVRRGCLVVSLAAGLVAAAAAAAAAAADDDSASIDSRALDATASGTTRAALAEATPVVADKAMVVTAQHLATRVGVQVLKDGGNAVDAAVAVGYALAVVHPCCGNIGGGGFMTVHMAAAKDTSARDLFLDFREKAPAAATPTLFQDDDGNVIDGLSTDSYRAVGVPGTVMGLEEARRRLGTMSRKRLMRPAIHLAENGYTLRPGDINILSTRSDEFADQPNVAAIFLNDGQPYKAGQTLKQPALATDLTAISKKGPDAFYKGRIADALVAASRAHDGILTKADLANYTAEWREPARCRYDNKTVVSAPPPSSGGVAICEILGILDPLPLADWGYASAETSHYLIEAERRAFADRNTYLGDPDFVDNPVADLLAPKHLKALREAIDAKAATPSSEIEASLGPREGTHTTHYSIVDGAGNAVGVTYTINYLFGNGQIADGTGFFLNNEMNDFTAKPGVPNAFGLVQGKANQVEGGKRPLSSMSPSLLLNADGTAFMVTGSPGGSTIISTTLESMMNVLDFDMNVQQAVNAPRLHNQWLPDVTRVEPGYLTQETQHALEDMGHSFKQVDSWGADEAVLVDPESGKRHGANDRRRPAGLAEGF